MESLLMDLKHTIGKIEQTSHGVGRINKDGITFTLVSPSMIEEGYGFEPAQSIQIYGAENILNLAAAMRKFCNGHFNKWEKQEADKA